MFIENSVVLVVLLVIVVVLLHFDDIQKVYRDVLEKGTMESFQSFLDTLPLDEEQHILTAMESVNRYGDELTDIEKINIMMASWLSKKVDKYLAQEGTNFKELTIPEVQFIDYARKREEKAMDRLEKARQEQTVGRQLHEVLDEIESIRAKTLAGVSGEKTEKIVLKSGDSEESGNDNDNHDK